MAQPLLSVASEALPPNTPDVEPLGDGRLLLDSSTHVYPLPSPQNRELGIGKSDFCLLPFE